MRQTINIVGVIGLMVFGLVACEYETLEPQKVEVPDSVGFVTDVVPIFNKSCNIQGCHAKSGISPDLTADNAYTSLTFFGYVNTDQPESSELYEIITTGSMKNFATDQDRAVILKWIEQGAQNN